MHLAWNSFLGLVLAFFPDCFPLIYFFTWGLYPSSSPFPVANFRMSGWLDPRPFHITHDCCSIRAGWSGGDGGLPCIGQTGTLWFFFFFLPNLSVPINKQRVPQSSPQTPNRELWWAVGTLHACSNVWLLHSPHEAGAKRKDIILKGHHFLKWNLESHFMFFRRSSETPTWWPLPEVLSSAPTVKDY